ncbi:hypothetical protein PRCB_09945 [Pantoea rodasii]|uniref:HNH nuclease domain-containing protein n=1 Tax=Pantoea rodasii TaxID=1076549 RepID=A0A2M9WDS4_9GAMM|nr:hypothetical protein [Pantoea rodasii]ORM63348.1 hypothetical protein HA45_13975 [Pantoea rodasii]PJZ05692.1 hypothetical protein PRCB_09945 [Pantoea rodasii]
MFKLERGSWPCCLEEHQQDWTARYIVARSQNPAARFRWFSEACYHAVRTALLEMTQHHCAFCDGFIGSESRETLEHFKPKSQFPESAFDWENLFPCCDMCQSQKREKYHAALIKPDRPDYDFDDYFICNFDNGEVAVAPDRLAENQHAAAITLETYGLNLPMRKKERLRQLRIWHAMGNRAELNEFAYRYFLSR